MGTYRRTSGWAPFPQHLGHEVELQVQQDYGRIFDRMAKLPASFTRNLIDDQHVPKACDPPRVPPFSEASQARRLGPGRRGRRRRAALQPLQMAQDPTRLRRCVARRAGPEATACPPAEATGAGHPNGSKSRARGGDISRPSVAREVVPEMVHVMVHLTRSRMDTHPGSRRSGFRGTRFANSGVESRPWASGSDTDTEQTTPFQARHEMVHFIPCAGPPDS